MEDTVVADCDKSNLRMVYTRAKSVSEHIHLLCIDMVGPLPLRPCQILRW